MAPCSSSGPRELERQGWGNAVGLRLWASGEALSLLLVFTGELGLVALAEWTNDARLISTAGEKLGINTKG